jgi:putative ABC transport system permease protein
MMPERLALLLAYPRFRAALLAVFAGFALLLAAIGLHGVLQQFVGQRTHEIGVRMAIGARRADIARLVARQGGLPVVAGLALGLACATGLGRYLSSLLYDVAPGDFATLMTVSLALMITAALAIAIPARRAVQVDPMVALRHE